MKIQKVLIFIQLLTVGILLVSIFFQCQTSAIINETTEIQEDTRKLLREAAFRENVINSVTPATIGTNSVSIMEVKMTGQDWKDLKSGQDVCHDENGKRKPCMYWSIEEDSQ